MLRLIEHREKRVELYRQPLYQGGSMLALVGGALSIGGAALARSPHELPSRHWAYGTVQDLAVQGMVQGYPRDRNLFAGRTVTRYEMASIVQRVLRRVTELSANSGKVNLPGAQAGDVRHLMDEFR